MVLNIGLVMLLWLHITFYCCISSKNVSVLRQKIKYVFILIILIGLHKLNIYKYFRIALSPFNVLFPALLAHLPVSLRIQVNASKGS